MSIKVGVVQTVGGMTRDLATAPKRASVGVARAVKKDTRHATTVMRRIARQASGPHGSNYFKRISGEQISPFTGEVGPTGDVAGNAVGAGWRHGPPNTDVQKTADAVGKKFADDVLDATKGVPWS